MSTDAMAGLVAALVISAALGGAYLFLCPKGSDGRWFFTGYVSAMLLVLVIVALLLVAPGGAS
jgi:hypothetical protein